MRYTFHYKIYNVFPQISLDECIMCVWKRLLIMYAEPKMLFNRIINRAQYYSFIRWRFHNNNIIHFYKGTFVKAQNGRWSNDEAR